jgi:hypothetical protein
LAPPRAALPPADPDADEPPADADAAAELPPADAAAELPPADAVAEPPPAAVGRGDASSVCGLLHAIAATAATTPASAARVMAAPTAP